MVKRYEAPWGKLLIIISIIATGILLIVPVVVAIAVPGSQRGLALLFVVILVGSAAYTIRGYGVSDTAVIVYHLAWQRRFLLTELKNLYHDPTALNRTIRLWGNGGLFSFSGYFRSSQLGTFKAYVMDRANSVVLEFGDKKVVLSPEQPQEFVDYVKQVAGL